MARQAILPGFPSPTFVNETGTRSAVLSGTYLDETASSTYAVSVAESGTLADAPSNVATLPSAIAEAGSAADASSNVAVLPSSISEAGSAADILSNVAVLPSTIAESGVAADALDALLSTADAVAEIGTLAEAVSAQLVTADAVSEAGALADQQAVAGLDAAAPGDVIEVDVTIIPGGASGAGSAPEIPVGAVLPWWLIAPQQPARKAPRRRRDAFADGDEIVVTASISHVVPAVANDNDLDDEEAAIFAILLAA